MQSKATIDPTIISSDLAQVFVHNGHAKREKCLSPLVFQEFDISSGTVTIPGSNGSKIIAALEDTRVAIFDDDLSFHIMESIDKFDANVAESVEKTDEIVINEVENPSDIPEDDIFTFSNIDSFDHSTSIISTDEDISDSISLKTFSTDGAPIPVDFILRDDAYLNVNAAVDFHNNFYNPLPNYYSNISLCFISLYDAYSRQNPVFEADHLKMVIELMFSGRRMVNTIPGK